MTEREPALHIKQGTCAYCGDAPVNHFFSYIEKLISVNIDGYTTRTIRYAPGFIKSFANWIPIALFHLFLFLGLAQLSDDIDKACSFRSRVIWEEAKRRGIEMKQFILFGKPIDFYTARMNGKNIYFESIPMPHESAYMKDNWDDKFILKRELSKHNIPIPKYFRLSLFGFKSLNTVFAQLEKPIIVKPQLGSRARHTTTNINTYKEFERAVSIARQICPYLVVEEHLEGHVCRATLVGGRLAGFYVGRVAEVVGDGERTIHELIQEKDAHRPERVERIHMSQELDDHIGRLGFTLDSILPVGTTVTLSHRRGRLFGGTTEEMIDTLHPSFIPILESAAKAVDLPVLGFDCIIPDPTMDQASQKWGIIECNTLPFIDLHYYALIGKPRNIAGMVWDLWK